MIGNGIYVSNVIGSNNSWFGVYNSAGIELFVITMISHGEYIIVPLLQDLQPYNKRQLIHPKIGSMIPILLTGTNGIYYWYSEDLDGFRFSVGNEAMITTNCEHKDSKIWLEIVTWRKRIYFKTQLGVSNPKKFFEIMGLWRG